MGQRGQQAILMGGLILLSHWLNAAPGDGRESSLTSLRPMLRELRGLHRQDAATTLEPVTVVQAGREDRKLLGGDWIESGAQVSVPKSRVAWFQLMPQVHLLAAPGAEWSWVEGAAVQLKKGEFLLIQALGTPARVVETPGFGVQGTTQLGSSFEVWMEVNSKSSQVSTLRGRAEVELLRPAAQNGLRGGWERYRSVPQPYQIEGSHEPQKWTRFTKFSPAMTRLNIKERFPELTTMGVLALGEMAEAKRQERIQAAMLPTDGVNSKGVAPPRRGRALNGKERKLLEEHQREFDRGAW